MNNFCPHCSRAQNPAPAGTLPGDDLLYLEINEHWKTCPQINNSSNEDITYQQYNWLVFKQLQTQKDITRLQDSVTALQEEINKIGGWKNVAVNSIRFCDESVIDERKQFNEHIMRS